MEALFEPVYRLMGAALPFDWAAPDFMKRALLAVLFICPMCATLGVQVVNFRLAFFSDAISHSAFTGIALGLLLGVDPTLTMVLFGLAVALGIVRVRRGSDLSTDTVIAVFFSAAVAVGITLISARKGLGSTLQSYLYGDVLAVGDAELVGMLSLTFVANIFLAVTYNRLLYLGIHKTLAKTAGISVRFYEYAFAVLLALAVTSGIRSVGILLITAMLVVPAAAARNFARSAGGMFWASGLVATFSGVAGLAASYAWDTATGATIILFSTGFFILSQVLNALLRSRR